MSTHAKLFARVAESSLTAEPKNAQLAFLLLLAIADVKGRVIGTDDRLATRINFTLPDFSEALVPLLSPDPNSSSKLHEGRRLVRIEEPRGYKIVNYAAYQGRKVAGREIDPALCPTCPEALAVAAIFRRRQETEWDEKEIAAFKGLMKRKAFHLEDLALVHRFYEFERKKSDAPDGSARGFHRRNLITFLNNYLGELDKARAWAHQNPRMAARVLKSEHAPEPRVPLVEPDGFRAWWEREYPHHAELAFHLIPPDVRAKYQP